MKMESIHQHGMFCQKIRAATNVFEKLQAVAEYEKYMDAVENDMIMTHQRLEMTHIGKTAD